MRRLCSRASGSAATSGLPTALLDMDLNWSVEYSSWNAGDARWMVAPPPATLARLLPRRGTVALASAISEKRERVES